MPELSSAGADYGRAFCLSPDRAALPTAQLAPQEVQCIDTVGLRFQDDVDKALGLGGGGLVTDPPLIQRLTVTGPQGTAVGSLTFADGSVTFCQQKDSTAKRCALVGYGLDGFHAAHDILAALGFQVHTGG